MTIPVRFSRKPTSLDDVQAAANDHHACVYDVEVVETRDLSTAEYDLFTHSFLDDRPWLAGKGGWTEDGTRRVVAVVAPDRATLYVDPSGYSYARYVGMALPYSFAEAPRGVKTGHTPKPWAYEEATGRIYYADGDVEPTIATDIDEAAGTITYTMTTKR